VNKKPTKLIEVIKDDLIDQNYPDKIKLLTGLIDVIRKLRESNLQVVGPLTAKIFDFLSYLDMDIKLAIQVIDYFRKYYGQTHLRLAIKLYLTALLIEEKDCRLRNQLLNEALKIARIISPTDIQMKQSTRGRQANSSFLNEIEKQLFISKNSLQFDRKMVEQRPRYRSASRSRIPLVRFSVNLYS